MVSAIIDIVALALIVGSCIVGCKKGFAKTFVSTFGSILAIIFALLLSGAVAKFLEKQFFLTTKIANGLEGTLTKLFGNELMNTTIEQASNTNMSEAGISSIIIRIVLSAKNNPSISPDTTLNKIVAPTFGYYITALIGFFILFLLFKIALFLVAELIFKAHKWKPVKSLDITLGALFGIIRGILIIQILVMIINVLPFGFFKGLSLSINKTLITNALSKVNFFPAIINAVLDSTHIFKTIISA